MRPSKEEFELLWKDATDGTSNEQKFKSIAEKKQVESRTVRNWYEFYHGDLRVNETIKSAKSFKTWITEYRDEEPKTKAKEAFMSVGKRCLIVCMADAHIGAKACLRERLAKDIEEIKDLDDVYVVYAGDIIDYGPDAPKGLLQDQQIQYQTQIAGANLMFDDIGHKVIATTSGCHSHFTANLTGKTLEEDLADKTLTKIFLNDGGLLNLTVGEICYKVFITHRTKGSSRLNPSRALMQMNEMDLDFDVGIEAHRHTPNINVSLRRQKSIVAINCGAYKGLDTFANRFAYIQQPCNVPGFILDGKKRQIIPFLDWHEGLSMI